MTKVVYNSCYGGFSFSNKACLRLMELNVCGADTYGSRSVCRHDPKVIQVIEELGEDANGRCASLHISSIPGTKYRIDEYDGSESVATPDSYSWIDASE